MIFTSERGELIQVGSLGGGGYCTVIGQFNPRDPRNVNILNYLSIAFYRYDLCRWHPMIHVIAPSCIRTYFPHIFYNNVT